MKTTFSLAVARPVAMIAIVLAVLISESVDATSILRGTLCDDQQPVQAELEERSYGVRVKGQSKTHYWREDGEGPISAWKDLT